MVRGVRLCIPNNPHLRALKYFLALFFLATMAMSPAYAQHAPSSAQIGATQSRSNMPINSPEPLSMIALAGGAAAAAGMAGRRRNKK